MSNIKWRCDECGYETETRPEKLRIKCPECKSARLKSYVLCKCGDWFHPERLEQLYCSKECANKHKKADGKKGKHYPHLQKARVALCPVCGKEFRATKEYKGRETVYCSKECWAKRATIIKKCEYCGREIKTYKSANRKFCSTECRNLDYRRRTGALSTAWQGGKTTKAKCLRTSKAYVEWRAAVFMRDGYKCQACGKTDCYLEAHHIKEACNYPDLIFDVDNGLTLCHDCHAQTDNYANKAKKKAGEPLGETED